MRTSTQDISPDASARGQLDWLELLWTIWKGKWIILAGTVLSCVTAMIVVLNLADQYKATVLLMPASTSNTSSLSRLASEFSGLASLAGLSIGGHDDSETKITAAIELIKSWGFQEEFIRTNHLEVAVFAATGWDRRTNQLLIDTSLYVPQQKKWVRKFNPEKGQKAEPGGWELHEKLSKRITIVQDKKTGLVTLSVEFYSPYQAKEWTDKLIVAVNKYLQEQDRTEAEKSLRYLEEKMSQTTLVEMKVSLSRLIEEQTKNLMLARVSNEYVLRTLSPAKIPEVKSRPKRAIICALSAAVGGFLSIVGWLGWSMFRRLTADRNRSAA